METLPALPQHQVDSLIAQAIDKNVSVEALERLLAMRTQLKQEYAAERFNAAMAHFQAACPIIKKTKSVTTKTGVVAYRYAPIESIVHQVKHLIKECCFSYRIETETQSEYVTAVCKVMHVDGHSESSSFTVPLGTQTQVMSSTQVVAAALTFAKRYAFCNAFGILTGDEDNDARRVEIHQDQVDEVRRLFELAGIGFESTMFTSILTKYGVKSIEEMTEQQGYGLIEQLKRYIERRSKEGE